MVHYITFKVHSIIPSLNEKNQNKKCPLIINSISRRNCLKIKVNKPVFLYFTFSNYKEICLKYEYENSYNNQPMIASFFTKEKLVFNIEIYGNNNNIIDREINYKEDILFKTDPIKTYFYISQYEKEMEIDPTLIIKISQNNSTPIYLQKDQLNSGFLPIGLNFYYYYMEVFKGEEGEIILFNKWQNGRLISRIMEKNNTIITPDINEFPKLNESDVLSNGYLEFNIHYQKVSFKSSQTEKCEKLLIIDYILF